MYYQYVNTLYLFKTIPSVEMTVLKVFLEKEWGTGLGKNKLKLNLDKRCSVASPVKTDWRMV